MFDYPTHILIASIDLLVNVQRSFTRRLPELDIFNYTEKLAFLNLPSLELHKLRIDCNLMYNIMHIANFTQFRTS